MLITSLKTFLNTNKKGLFFLLFSIYYYTTCVCRGKLYYHKTNTTNPTYTVIQKCLLVLTSYYFPNPLLSNGFVQSVLGPVIRPSATGLSFVREFHATPDGGTICLSWANVEGVKLNNNAPVIFLLPGTNGDELTSWYIHLACKNAIVRYGYHVVVYVRRYVLYMSQHNDRN
jgi:hypothetical protein